MRSALPLGLSKNHNQYPHISSPLNRAVYSAYKSLYDEQKCSSSAWLLIILSHKIVFKSGIGEPGRFNIRNSNFGSDEFPIFIQDISSFFISKPVSTDGSIPLTRKQTTYFHCSTSHVSSCFLAIVCTYTLSEESDIWAL